LEAFAALGAAMHRHAGRLVDDQHQPIAIEHAAHHLFRCHGQTAITAPVMNETNPDEVSAETAAPAEPKRFWRRLSAGLRRTSSSIGGAITGLVTKRRLDDAMIEELEDALIRADLGLATAARITEAIREGRYDKEITPDEVKMVLATEVEKVLDPVAKPLVIAGARPFVILVVGVNGSGKTTTIGKLAAKYRAEGRKVVLAAGDTFRAAAIDQLK